MFTYMIPMVLQIFNPCYYGNEVTLSSEKLSMNLFHAEWFKENQKFRVAFKMVMENARKPIIVNAAHGAFRVNLTTFLSIINSAYSLYAVLQKIN